MNSNQKKDNKTEIKNFSIIAHIDHGKTTLTDRFLKLTKTIPNSKKLVKERIMDSNPIEQEKGITIKLAPVRMNYQHQSQQYQLNLIDTPGHVDFGYEVSRSLAACEGAILLIDASQGIQAQTMANYQKAKKLHLKIIPVINKIDLKSAQVEETVLTCMETFGLSEDDFLYTSAKTGQGVESVLEAIIARVPNAPQKEAAPLKVLIITSIFDNHLGAIAYVRVMSGKLTNKDLYLMSSDTKFQPKEIGFFSPDRKACSSLQAGEVGYIATGLKDISLLKIGDTITTYEERANITPLPGFKEPTPMVFMELFPTDNADYTDLEDAMSKLTLHDSALQYQGTHSVALGNGLRVGFLGIFHAEIIRERLKREFDLDLIATAPSVKYQILLKTGETTIIENPSELPNANFINEIKEPIARVTIFCPFKYNNKIIKYVRTKRGRLLNSNNIGSRTKFTYEIPFSELISNFHDKLKSITSGFASLEYELIGYESANIVKVDILINKEVIEALSFMTIEDKAEHKSRSIVKKLKEVVPKQQFEIPIQAAIGGTIIARETKKAYRKDVTAKLYGGDVTRKKKLLKKQAEGKKKLKEVGSVQLNQDTFLAVLEE